ncbi:hypothetical protein GGR95_001419 [Sulfitobacter undariae]|uniref:Glycosyl transferase family 2 n=1 Tax=Sulfitobacter undariae TaxID=1563671 RepID=A0A7W6E2Y4_9RHOB|nr:hypothetical protein [Sulfitobacter undariae]
MANDLKITAVTCVKNEGPFLLEWIAYHQCIGVTDFLFYSNDCDDGTDTLLNALQELEHVQHLPNPAEGRNYQMEALKDAKKRDIVRNADWVWIADVDEFPNIHVGDHSLPALIEACGNPQAISLNFQFFANNDIETFQDRPVIKQFTHCHNPDIWRGEAAIEVKTLVRQDFPLKYYGAHRPFSRDNVQSSALLEWTDGAGRKVPNRFLTAALPRHIRCFPAAGSRKFATLNHYALRSMDSYLVKNDRGDVNRENRAFDDIYWRERNDPAWEDTSIHRYLPAMTARMDALKAQANIGTLHEASVAAHIARRDALLEQKVYRDMQTQLRTASKLPPQEEAILRELGLWEEVV